MKKIIIGLIFLLSAINTHAFEMATTIAHEYPNADVSQYAVENDGSGQALVYWDSALGAQPSLATLQAAWPGAELVKAKRLKTAEVKAEGLSRIQEVLLGIVSFEQLQLIREMILSVTPASRQLTANIQSASDTYQAGSDAVVVLNGYTSTEQIDAFNIVSDVSWP